MIHSNIANFFLILQNNTCIPCECNGNVDPALGLVCDRDDGTCLNCLNNTDGPNCEQCIKGYFGAIPETPCKGQAIEFLWVLFSHMSNHVTLYFSECVCNVSITHQTLIIALHIAYHLLIVFCMLQLVVAVNYQFLSHVTQRDTANVKKVLLERNVTSAALVI